MRLAFALCFTLACADDDVSTSGVPGDKRLSRISAEERVTLCRWEVDEDYAQFTPLLACTEQAVRETSTKEECERARDACLPLETAERERDYELRIQNCTVGAFASTCRAMVKDLEACVRATLGWLHREASRFQCGSPKPGGSTPPTCKALPLSCFAPD